MSRNDFIFTLSNSKLPLAVKATASLALNSITERQFQNALAQAQILFQELRNGELDNIRQLFKEAGLPEQFADVLFPVQIDNNNANQE